jgi:hypothetical protein
MASGSRKGFLYVDDDNAAEYAILLDESNGEANLGGLRLTREFSGTPLGRPCNIQMRYINTVNRANPIQRKRFIVGDPETFNTITSGLTVTEGASDRTQAATWTVLSKVGQVTRFISGTDSGLTDGDNP